MTFAKPFFSSGHLLSRILFCRPDSEGRHPGLQPSELDVLTYLFLQQLLAQYHLDGSSWVVGEVDTKLTRQETNHCNTMGAVKERGCRESR